MTTQPPKTIKLPKCSSCGAYSWPRRAACPQCFSVPLFGLPLADAPAEGTVLSTTTIHVSLDPGFSDRLPACVASVQLDAGPVVLAFAEPGVEAGQTVQIDNQAPSGERPVWRVLALPRAVFVGMDP